MVVLARCPGLQAAPGRVRCSSRSAEHTALHRDDARRLERRQPRLLHVVVVHACAALALPDARQAHGIRRVAVVDFDVHHGNGTQARFRDDPELMYLSSHQWPLYPGTGAAHETGVADNLVNLCLEPTAGTAEFRRVWSETGLPRLRAFAPELVIISAGFDGHEHDPLASLNLTNADYGWITGEIMTIATECCDGRLVSVLEGGYDLDALQSATRVHVSTLQGETAPPTEGS